MTKTLRASVSFPLSLHRSLKLTVAGAERRVTLTAFVARIVAASGSISDRAIWDSRATLTYDPNRNVRSTITFPRDIADRVNARAEALDMSPSEFVAAVVAHKLSRNGGNEKCHLRKPALLP